MDPLSTASTQATPQQALLAPPADIPASQHGLHPRLASRPACVPFSLSPDGSQSSAAEESPPAPLRASRGSLVTESEGQGPPLTVLACGPPRPPPAPPAPFLSVPLRPSAPATLALRSPLWPQVAEPGYLHFLLFLSGFLEKLFNSSCTASSHFSLLLNMRPCFIICSVEKTQPRVLETMRGRLVPQEPTEPTLLPCEPLLTLSQRSALCGPYPGHQRQLPPPLSPDLPLCTAFLQLVNHSGGMLTTHPVSFLPAHDGGAFTSPRTLVSFPVAVSLAPVTPAYVYQLLNKYLNECAELLDGSPSSVPVSGRVSMKPRHRGRGPRCASGPGQTSRQVLVCPLFSSANAA